MDEFSVEYDDETGEYVASTPVEDYCTPSVHLAYIWLASQILESEAD